jgi:excisionase family DNA binding protein
MNVSLITVGSVEDDEWVDVETASRYLNLSPTTIDRLVRDGKLTAIGFPALLRRRDLDLCFERCRIRPGEMAHLSRRTPHDPCRRSAGAGIGPRRLG